MSQEHPKDTISFILAQDENLQEVLRLLSNSDDWYRTALDQFNSASKNLVDPNSTEGSIRYFNEAESCLAKALSDAESAHNMEKLSKEAEKAALRSTELINNINTLNFDLKSKRSFLESIADAINLGDWELVYQYGMDASKHWDEKRDYFLNIVEIAKTHFAKPQPLPFSNVLKRFMSKKR